jgi:hypothetical protein
MAHLANPLASPAQLFALNTLNSPLPPDLQHSIRFYTARLTQAAGLLLRLSQDITAQANVLLFRYWVIDPLLAWEFSVRLLPPTPPISYSEENMLITAIGCISKRPLPNSQDLRLSTLTTQHNKRLRLPPLPHLLPPNHCPHHSSRSRILLPVRNGLYHIPQSDIKHRRSDSQRVGIQYSRCATTSSCNHVSTDARCVFGF